MSARWRVAVIGAGRVVERVHLPILRALAGVEVVAIFDPDGFQEPSILSIMLGLGVMPQAHDPFVELIDEAALRTHFVRLRAAIAQTVAGMPDHADYIARHVLADAVRLPSAQGTPVTIAAARLTSAATG